MFVQAIFVWKTLPTYYFGISLKFFIFFISGGCILDKDTDYPGEDVGDKDGKSWQECREHCSKNKDCSFFTWGVKQKTCWLKRAMSKREKKNGLISGSALISTLDENTGNRYMIWHSTGPLFW